jgi:hypothetical protein
MVFTVRDLFENNVPVPTSANEPPNGSPLFNYIAGRLFDSFNLPGGVTKYYDWMITPDHDTGLWPVIRHGVVWQTILEEWPKIMADIDNGHPSPLGLVTVYDLNPGDLGNNHQVLAYAYNVDANNTLTLNLYDPNTGASDGCQLSMFLGNPSHSTPITHNVHIGFPIRGFFRVDYSVHDASSLAPPLGTLIATCTPFPVRENVAQSLTVQARDSSTGAAVAATVRINGANVGTAGHPFTHTFKRTVTKLRLPGTGSGRPGPGDLGTYIVYPTGQVVAAGYAPAAVDFGLKNHWADTSEGIAA